MAKIILATGGARSGKSAYAQNLAESLPGSMAFVATCPAPTGDDEEMQVRVERHRQDRLASDWLTIEEELNLKTVLEGNPQIEIMLIDCLTLWISNLMYACPEIDEKEMSDRAQQLISACRKRSGTVIFVTNEVGCGIVPENASARKFRDLSGRCNQIIAKAADEVIFCSCGLPLFLKQGAA